MVAQFRLIGVKYQTWSNKKDVLKRFDLDNFFAGNSHVRVSTVVQLEMGGNDISISASKTTWGCLPACLLSTT
jgi:hypothetical protein